ncbi:hypothetical protein [Lyngbya confervoides]|uniref:Uncharacterized protein n=1 Tax=Lyngbya confervoides BDU141951 TaxID=1574623 RepID=A0ABD4T9N2_9CYAN|nr:hypothetical protein [Lyngbya confervoides]MCM1985168.1 hypothetical protein [Lyngbya confervoides BDU141951]
MGRDQRHKICLNEVYPCPCKLKGHLKELFLVEAFGCDRCQQIFVLQPDQYTIQQLPTAYPYRRTWEWTGTEWRSPYRPKRYPPWLLGAGFFFIILLPLGLFLSLLLHTPVNLGMVVLVGLAVGLPLIGLLLLIQLRRR